MEYQLACKDTGVDCPFVAKGETKDKMMDVAVKHVKAKHGYTDKQINAPEMQKMIKAAINKK
jgi:predicted small metal-binding protein